MRDIHPQHHDRISFAANIAGCRTLASPHLAYANNNIGADAVHRSGEDMSSVLTRCFPVKVFREVIADIPRKHGLLTSRFAALASKRGMPSCTGTQDMGFVAPRVWRGQCVLMLIGCGGVIYEAMKGAIFRDAERSQGRERDTAHS
jgi:hypothetical protein